MGTVVGCRRGVGVGLERGVNTQESGRGGGEGSDFDLQEGGNTPVSMYACSVLVKSIKQKIIELCSCVVSKDRLSLAKKVDIRFGTNEAPE